MNQRYWVVTWCVIMIHDAIRYCMKSEKYINDEYYGSLSHDAAAHYLLRKKLQDVRSINLQVLAIAGISLFGLLLLILHILM